MSIIQNSDSYVVREADETIRIIAQPALLKGDTGPGGATGASGGILESFEGDWNSATAYTAGAIVHNPADGTGNGALYLAIASSTNLRPNGSGGSAGWSLLVDRGAIGPDGVQGDPGTSSGGTTSYSLPTWRGAWTSASRAYAVGDWVRATDGSAYHCKVAHTSNGSNGPLDDSTKWSLAVVHGSAGSTGSRGPRGFAGSNGSNGSDGSRGPAGERGETGSAGSNGTDAYADFCFDFAGNGAQRLVMPRTITLTTLDVAGNSATVVLQKNGTTFTLGSESFAPGDVLSVTVSALSTGNYKLVTLRGHYGS